MANDRRATRPSICSKPPRSPDDAARISVGASRPNPRRADRVRTHPEREHRPSLHQGHGARRGVGRRPAAPGRSHRRPDDRDGRPSGRLRRVAWRTECADDPGLRPLRRAAARSTRALAERPFGPELRDGRLYGRGVSDNKGPMLIPLKVAQAFFATRAAFPLNVKFLLEGEEEIGSRNLEPFLAANTQMLRADSVLSADGAMWRNDEPTITVASRGVSALEFSLKGASRNLHSGRYGGSIANALHAMAELVASLHSPDGRVAGRGFYDGRAPPPAG